MKRTEGNLDHNRKLFSEFLDGIFSDSSALKKTAFDLVKFLILMVILTWFFFRNSENLGYNWQWYRIPKYLFTFENGKFIAGPLFQGLLVTLKITVVSFFLAFAFGLITAILRLSRSFLGKALARIYLETIRNTPLLVQIFFIYFVLGPVLEINRLIAAVLALSLFEGAYASEIFRAGILSLHFGQWEASRSLGMTRMQTYRYVILPQALRRVIPPLTSQSISLIKDSALVSTIAVYDLTMQARSVISETYMVFELWFTVAAIYLVITVTLSFLAHMMEKRFRTGIT